MPLKPNRLTCHGGRVESPGCIPTTAICMV